MVGLDAGMGGSAVNWRYGRAPARAGGLIRVAPGTILDEVDERTGRQAERRARRER